MLIGIDGLRNHQSSTVKYDFKTTKKLTSKLEDLHLDFASEVSVCRPVITAEDD